MLPATDLAAHLNIEVTEPANVRGLAPQMLRQLVANDSSSWSAVTVIRGGSRLIIHNPTHNPGRRESNLMHEISHVICAHDPTRFVELPFAVMTCRTCSAEQEDEAGWLGGCLQLPRAGLVWALNKGMSDDDIALHFGASLQMTQFRLRMTGAKLQLVRTKRRRSSNE
jgi:Zn-dependent peptidase ImmA (M78 family)